MTMFGTTLLCFITIIIIIFYYYILWDLIWTISPFMLFCPFLTQLSVHFTITGLYLLLQSKTWAQPRLTCSGCFPIRTPATPSAKSTSTRSRTTSSGGPSPPASSAASSSSSSPSSSQSAQSKYATRKGGGNKKEVRPPIDANSLSPPFLTFFCGGKTFQRGCTFQYHRTCQIVSMPFIPDHL